MKKLSPDQRIVVTGIGAVSGYGIGVDPLFHGILAEKSCVKRLRTKGLGKLKSQIGAEVILDSDEDKITKMALLAAKEALQQAKLEEKQCGMVAAVGWSWPPARDLEHLELNHFSYDKNLRSVAAELQLGGEIASCLSACAASTQAIGQACERLKNGEGTCYLAGGSDSRINTLGMLGYEKLMALAADWNDEPEKASRPFDRSRQGFVVGEGAGFLVLETLAQAKRRNAPILAEIVSWAASCDAYRITDPDPSGQQAARCMTRCLEAADLEPSKLSWINTHGTSTPANDAMEAKALATTLGSYMEQVPLVAMKSFFGHLSMAAGAVEIIATILSLQKKIIPMTLNFHESDPGLSFRLYVNSVTKEVSHLEELFVLKNSFGFGGQNACLLIKSWNECHR